MEQIFYGTGKSFNRLHASPDCPKFNQKRTQPVRAFTLETTFNRKFCRTCFPQPKALTTVHSRCKICRQRQPLPCPHNGCVLVIAPQKVRLARRPGDVEGVQYSTRWVWAENAHRYTLAVPLT